MSRLRKILVLTVATTALAVPSHAFAETVLPPGNSAVNQYTQTLPTPKGNVSVEGDSIGQPNKVLGQKNTKKLDQEGEDGRAAAELAAATSPTSSEGSGGDSGAKSGSADDKEGSKAGGGGSGAGNGGDGNGSGGGAGAGGGSGSGTGSGTAASTIDTSSSQGSSGLGTVLGQATGSSTSGGLGLLMPLAIVLGLIWCMAYLWRQRQPTA